MNFFCLKRFVVKKFFFQNMEPVHILTVKFLVFFEIVITFLFRLKPVKNCKVKKLKKKFQNYQN